MVHENMEIARLKGWFEATEIGFVVNDDEKKNIDNILRISIY